MEVIVLTRLNGYDENLKTFEEIKSSLTDDSEIKECYYYYLALLHYQNEYYQESLNTLMVYPQSGRIMALLAGGIMYQPNRYYQKEYLPLLVNYPFTKYEEIYYQYVCFIKMTIEETGPYQIWNYLKSIFNKGYYFDYFVYTTEIKYYLELGLATSKYKETLRTIINITKKLEYISLNHLLE